MTTRERRSSANNARLEKVASQCHSTGDILHLGGVAVAAGTEAVGAASLDVAAQQVRVDAELALEATTDDI